MIRDNEIWQELKELGSPLANMPHTMPYAVPEGYFDTLTSILAKNAAQVGNLAPLPAWSFDLPFSVPENYFDTLPEHLLAAVKAVDKNPQNEKVTNIRLHWRKKGSLWAAAAAVVLGVWFGAYKYVAPAASETTIARQLAAIDSNVINTYIVQHTNGPDVATPDMLSDRISADLYASISSLKAADIQAYLSDEESLSDYELPD